MIRLTRTSDYGMVLMAHLASRRGGEPCNAREVAAEAQVPLPMASKVLKSLAREGLLVSHRGAKGGYSLARRPEEISAAEMITALEGPIALTRCAIHPGHCEQEPSCHVRVPWQRINAVVQQALADVTLADLARSADSPDTLPLANLGFGPPAGEPRP